MSLGRMHLRNIFHTHKAIARKQSTTTANQPLQQINHYSKSTTTANQPLQQVNHYSKSTTTASQPLQQINYYRKSTTTANQLLQKMENLIRYSFTLKLQLGLALIRIVSYLLPESSEIAFA